jgi:hypothetical protein
MRHAADTAQKTAKPGNACNRQRATDSRRHARAREHMRDATGNTRQRHISCAASSGQRTSSSMREALNSTTSAQHGTDATHTMQHTTGAAACSKHTRNRQIAAGIETYEETKGIRTLPRLEAPGFLSRKQPQVPSRIGDASDVAARRLHISLACAHRWPTDVDRPRCWIRTRLGAREVHAVGSCCPPRPRLPASRHPKKPPAISTMSPHSALEVRVLRRCFQCAATRIASCPCRACCRRATSRQARSACENGGVVASQC